MKHFQYDENVKWSESKQKGNGFSISTKEGKVVSVDAEIVTVKYRGKEKKIHESNLRRVNETSELTELVQSMAS